jgi:hypothetical protein
MSGTVEIKSRAGTVQEGSFAGHLNVTFSPVTFTIERSSTDELVLGLKTMIASDVWRPSRPVAWDKTPPFYAMIEPGFATCNVGVYSGKLDVPTGIPAFLSIYVVENDGVMHLSIHDVAKNTLFYYEPMMFAWDQVERITIVIAIP